MARNVLIVDDESDILESLQVLIEGSIPDVSVRTALSAELALASLDQPTDLILSDYKMPGMNGLEFLLAVKDKLPTVPRILMTAFPDLEVAIGAINNAGIDQFLTKPIEPETAIEAVKEALARRDKASSSARAFAKRMAGAA